MSLSLRYSTKDMVIIEIVHEHKIITYRWIINTDQV